MEYIINLVALTTEAIVQKQQQEVPIADLQLFKEGSSWPLLSPGTAVTLVCSNGIPTTAHTMQPRA